jgi:hypothetical protein
MMLGTASVVQQISVVAIFLVGRGGVRGGNRSALQLL